MIFDQHKIITPILNKNGDCFAVLEYEPGYKIPKGIVSKVQKKYESLVKYSKKLQKVNLINQIKQIPEKEMNKLGWYKK